MKYIQLTRGKIAIVDDDDFDRLNKWKWYSDKGCARRNVPSKNGSKRTFYYMHWEVIGKPKKGMEVDHINQNKSDNRKENLRICTHADNTRNAKLRKDNTSGCRGVVWHKFSNLWRAQISINGSTKCIGYFNNKSDAIMAYNNAAKEYYGEFAQLNKL